MAPSSEEARKIVDMFRLGPCRLRSRRPCGFLTCALVAIAAAPGGAVAQLLGPEFQVNSYTTGTQSYPRVAADPAGRFVVVWRSDGQDGSEEGAFGQRFDADDAPEGTEFQLNESTAGRQLGARVAKAADGSFVVTWSDISSSPRRVPARRFDAAGLPLGGEFQVNSDTSLLDAGAIDVAFDAAGNFVILWYFRRGILSETGGAGQRFDSAGQPVGSEFSVGPGGFMGHGLYGPDSLAMTGPGEFVVGQKLEYGGYPGPSLYSPAVQRFDEAGRVGDQILVQSSTTMSAPWPVRVASAGAGEFVVTWSAYEYYGWGPNQVFARRYDEGGAPRGEMFAVGNSPSAQIAPVVAADKRGNFLIVWASEGELFGKRYAADGSVIGTEFQVNSYTTGVQSSHSVAAGKVGDFIVSWQSDGQDGSSKGVFARRIRSSIFWGGFELGDPCGWSTVVGGGCS